MGQKDYVEEDGAGLILDLEYLHIDGAERPAGPGAGVRLGQGEEEQGGSGGGGVTSPGEAEEGAGFDSEPEQGPNTAAPGTEPASPGPPCSGTHQPLCRTPCVDLGGEGPPEPPQGGPRPGPGLRDYQTKLDFALKLGYAEETVRGVLTKLGPDTLINDILGELVKLSSKPEREQGTGPVASQPASTSFSSSSSTASSACGLPELGDAQRADSPRPALAPGDKDNLRPVVVDGSNVAMSHGNKEVFSCHGIQLAVDWFLEQGHRDVTVFVPAWRKEQSRPDAPITDQEILRHLEREKLLVFTPSRRVQGRRVVCYDDRFIVKLAYESDGIIVSNDNYRDLANEKPEWKKFIDERLLMYSFVNDKFMPPDDPLGRHGPSLENFLRKRPIMPEQKKQPCPYGKKCTYGHKCKFYHPERGGQPQRSVADELRAGAKPSGAAARALGEAGLAKSHSVPAGGRAAACRRPPEPGARALSYSEAEDRLLCAGRRDSLCGGGGGTLSPGPGGPSSYAPPEPQDAGYYSVTRPRPALGSRRFHSDVDPWPGSAPSDCGSEGSSCDSYGEGACPGCPDPLLDGNSLPYTNPHHGRPYPGQNSALHSYRQIHGYLHPHPHHAHTQPHPQPSPAPTRPLYPLLPPQLQHQAAGVRSSCLGDCPSPPPARPRSPGSPLARCLAATRMESLSDSRLCEPPRPAPPRQAFSSWDRLYQQPPPCPGAESRQSDWRKATPAWGLEGYPQHPPHLPLPPCSPYPSAAPHPAQNPHTSRPPHYEHMPPPAYSPHLPPAPHPHRPSHPPMCPMHQQPHPGGRAEQGRETVYVHLCNIFPSELVGRVMARSPHLTDPQQLAAAILVEKGHGGY